VGGGLTPSTGALNLCFSNWRKFGYSWTQI
jgi:hypothetical protein